MPHPYTTTLQGLTEVIQQLRQTFPQQITSETLKKWSMASNNEGTVLAVLRFLKIIDEEGKKQSDAAKVFIEHDNSVFAQQFAGLVRAAYKDLFDTWGEQSWNLDKNKLIGFFRSADQSTARVGEQQYKTFQVLASLAGHSSSESKSTKQKGTRTFQAKTPRPKPNDKADTQPSNNLGEVPPSFEKNSMKNNVALTVRIEINLPISDNQDVYDKIFRSIKENFLSE